MITDPSDILVAKPLATLVEFYDTLLKPLAPLSADMGDGSRESVAGGTYLYECSSVDLNELTAETGCIYLTAVGSATTRIKTQLLRSEGVTFPCPSP